MERTLGQMVKAKLYRQNLTQKHTHTHSQKEEKGEISKVGSCKKLLKEQDDLGVSVHQGSLLWGTRVNTTGSERGRIRETRPQEL